MLVEFAIPRIILTVQSELRPPPPYDSPASPWSARSLRSALPVERWAAYREDAVPRAVLPRVRRVSGPRRPVFVHRDVREGPRVSGVVCAWCGAAIREDLPYWFLDGKPIHTDCAKPGLKR